LVSTAGVAAATTALGVGVRDAAGGESTPRLDSNRLDARAARCG